jgi:hypothetical protein
MFYPNGPLDDLTDDNPMFENSVDGDFHLIWRNPRGYLVYAEEIDTFLGHIIGNPGDWVRFADSKLTDWEGMRECDVWKVFRSQWKIPEVEVKPLDLSDAADARAGKSILSKLAFWSSIKELSQEKLMLMHLESRPFMASGELKADRGRLGMVMNEGDRKSPEVEKPETIQTAAVCIGEWITELEVDAMVAEAPGNENVNENAQNITISTWSSEMVGDERLKALFRKKIVTKKCDDQGEPELQALQTCVPEHLIEISQTPETQVEESTSSQHQEMEWSEPEYQTDRFHGPEYQAGELYDAEYQTDEVHEPESQASEPNTAEEKAAELSLSGDLANESSPSRDHTVQLSELEYQADDSSVCEYQSGEFSDEFSEPEYQVDQPYWTQDQFHGFHEFYRHENELCEPYGYKPLIAFKDLNSSSLWDKIEISLEDDRIESNIETYGPLYSPINDDSIPDDYNIEKQKPKKNKVVVPSLTQLVEESDPLDPLEVDFPNHGVIGQERFESKFAPWTLAKLVEGSGYLPPLKSNYFQNASIFGLLGQPNFERDSLHLASTIPNPCITVTDTQRMTPPPSPPKNVPNFDQGVNTFSKFFNRNY